MLELMKKIFFGTKKSENTPAIFEQDEALHEALRYPPFAKGLPALDTKYILETQSELITRIERTLRFTRDEFAELVYPVIENYAAYVHLLPASETHHHRGAGGLFRHGLEVGLWAAQSANAHVFCIDESPRNKRDNEPRWQFAAFLGGLLHDVGKPLSDVAVTSKDGLTVWNPYESNLALWAKNENLEYYFLRWRNKRNKRHEKFSIMNLDQIITQKAKTHLNKPGPKIMESLLESIVGTSAQETLTQLVLSADQESVRRDLVNQRMDVDEFSYGVPVERFVFDALRRLATLTKVNEPGSLIWHTEHGVFLVWKKIVSEIHNLIEKDNIPGIPRNHDTLADILIERGLAIPYQEATESKPVNYWNICPECLDGISLRCLRIDSIELIFSSEPPPPVKIILNNPISESVVTTKKNNMMLLEEDNIAKPVGNLAEVMSELELVLDQVDMAAQTALPTTKVDSKNLNKKDISESSTAISSDSKTHNLLHDPSWNIINKALAIMKDPTKKTVLVKLQDGNYGIPYPSGARNFGEPRDVMNILYKNSLLHVSPISATKTTSIDGEKFLVIDSKATDYISDKLATINQGNNNSNGIDTVFDQKKFQKDVITQIINGFGPYIDGDVEIILKDQQTTYKLKAQPTVKIISAYYNWPSTRLAALALDKIEGLKLRDDFYIFEE